MCVGRLLSEGPDTQSSYAVSGDRLDCNVSRDGEIRPDRDIHPRRTPPVVNLKGIYDQHIPPTISSPHAPGHNRSSNSVVWKEEVFS